MLLSFNVFACDDSQADTIIEKRAILLAKRYNATSVGIGASIVYGFMRTTNIVIIQGVGGPSELIDRVGSIAINMETCKIMNSLVSVFDVLEVNY